MANFETFWFSNHGYLGHYDTLTTIVAKRANNIYFNPRQKQYDKDLVSDFVHKLQKPSDKNRLFILHFIDSHPITCNRLLSDDYKNYKDKESFDINCYVESLRQTDNDLKGAYEALQQNFHDKNETFSMIYFSDHGLSHIKKHGKISLNFIDNIAKEHLQIPLIKLSSNDDKRTFIKNESYQSHFPQSFANWLGISVSNFDESEKFDIFSKISHPDTLNAKSLIKNHNADRAIDISEFLRK